MAYLPFREISILKQKIRTIILSLRSFYVHWKAITSHKTLNCTPSWYSKTECKNWCLLKPQDQLCICPVLLPRTKTLSIHTTPNLQAFVTWFENAAVHPPVFQTALWTLKCITTNFRKEKSFSNKTRKLTNLQIFNYRGIVVYGLSVHSFSHPLSIESKLLHCLLLCKIRSFVEQLPRCLVLEPRHMEKSGRRANFCGHGYLVSERLQEVKHWVTT